MIEVRGLTKRIGSSVVVDDLTFTVGAGIVTGFLGPNGAGKTTTLRLMLGLDHPTSGTAWINGRPYLKLPAPMREVGAVLNASSVHGNRNAHDHLLCLARSNRLPTWRVHEVLELVGLASMATRGVRTFSRGMLQRLGIAAALLGDPAILIFDEPVAGLDPEGIQWTRVLLRRLADEGRTVLVATHLVNELSVTMDQLIIIGRGRLLAQADMDTLIGSAPRWTLVRTAQPADVAGRLTSAGATVRSGTDSTLLVSGMGSSEICRVATAARAVLTELAPQRTSLEEVYMELTRGHGQFDVVEGAA